MLINYILKKFFTAIFVLFGVIFLTFLLTYIIPGDPLAGLIGEYASPESILQLRHELGLNASFLRQFQNYSLNILQGNLGKSFYTQESVSQSIKHHFVFTLRLAILAVLFAAFLGILAGSAAALNKGKIFDSLIIIFVLLGTSFPVFWVGMLFLYFFSLKFQLLASSSIILPALTLGIRPCAFIARLTRIKILEILSSDFIKTAFAKGLPYNRIFFRHVMSNVSLPLITLISLDLGNFLAGAAITETVFSYPGIGKFLLTGILRRDYPVIMGSVFFVAFIIMLVNLIVDILYAFLDPRVKFSG